MRASSGLQSLLTLLMSDYSRRGTQSSWDLTCWAGQWRPQPLLQDSHFCDKPIVLLFVAINELLGLLIRKGLLNFCNLVCYSFFLVCNIFFPFLQPLPYVLLLHGK